MGNKEYWQLLEKLKTIRKQEDEEEFLRRYSHRQEAEINTYLKELMNSRAMKFSEVLRRSHINKNYGYNIINGRRTNVGRDKILALCIGAEMSFDETQEFLRVAGHSSLNPYNARDVRIAVAINNRMYDVLRVNIRLEEHGLAPLEV